jgi:ankyrin repeat protein
MSTENNFFQTNPIFVAVANANTNALNTAIIQGNKINVTDESGITALDYAILTLKYSMVKPILVFVNLLLPSEKTAMLNQSLKVLVKAIEKYSTNVNEDLSDDYAVFNDLKSAGADLSIIIDDAGNTLYHYAIKMNSQTLFDALVEANIDCNVCNASGYDALLYASVNNRVDFVTTLIPKSSNLTITEPYSNKSLLMIAVEQNNFEHVQSLLNLINDTNYINLVDYNGKSALHRVAEQYQKTEAATYIDCFASKNGNFNIQDIFGNTPLHVACQRLSNFTGSECFCMIKRLVNNGASLYIKNNVGVMPIEMTGVSKSLINDLC